GAPAGEHMGASWHCCMPSSPPSLTHESEQQADAKSHALPTPRHPKVGRQVTASIGSSAHSPEQHSWELSQWASLGASSHPAPPIPPPPTPDDALDDADETVDDPPGDRISTSLMQWEARRAATATPPARNAARPSAKVPAVT